MHAELQTHVAFHLTGKRLGAGLDAVGGLGLRPALLAGYRNLTRLRYDFPLLLVRNVPEDACVQSLSGVVDGLVHETARGDDGERLTRHLLRLEQEIRVLIAEGTTGSLSALWDTAASRLAARADESFQDSARRARSALKVDGEVVDCSEAMPARLLMHAWTTVQDSKARRFHDDVGRLILKLSDILRSDFVRSEAGRSAENLKASIGPAHDEVFDFEALSRLLAKALPKCSLPESRRRRIHWLLSVLESQRFFPATGAPGEPADGAEPYSFVFDSCAGALEAFRERLPRMLELAKAIAIARLEIESEYVEAKHDPFFEEFGDNALGPQGLTLFPAYLVCVNATDMQAAEYARLMEVLAAGLPVKVLVQAGDILEESPIRDEHLAFGARSRQLASMAIGLNEVYVLQSSSSNLFQLKDRILGGFAYPGPALFSVFSGASGQAGDLPPYLTAAAAMESRAFPAFSYDPSAGPEWASRFSLENNPQPDLDWPMQGFAYEDEEHQRISQDLAFTLVDFVACDRRYAGHFARVPRALWNARMAPVRECLAPETTGLPEKVPCLLLIDDNDVLQKVIVGDKLMREARRCREAWRNLQELGGIHNSHAERLLARERKAWEERREAETRTNEPKPAAEVATAAVAAVPAQEAAAAQDKPPPGEPYIETARCTTCDECIQINDKMFAYDANKQAHIVNPDAGTYRQLVEAAESCQVAIIHPGKPRNPNEPGLGELLQRAEPFL